MSLFDMMDAFFDRQGVPRVPRAPGEDPTMQDILVHEQNLIRQKRSGPRKFIRVDETPPAWPRAILDMESAERLLRTEQRLRRHTHPKELYTERSSLLQSLTTPSTRRPQLSYTPITIVRRTPSKPLAISPGRAPRRLSIVPGTTPRSPRQPTPRPIRGTWGRTATVIQRDTIPLHRQRGWKKRGSGMKGSYRTPYGSYKGEVTLAGTTPLDFYIYDAPSELLNGAHSGCFTSRGKRKHHIHWSTGASTVDVGITHIEKLLAETLS